MRINNGKSLYFIKLYCELSFLFNKSFLTILRSIKFLKPNSIKAATATTKTVLALDDIDNENNFKHNKYIERKIEHICCKNKNEAPDKTSSFFFPANHFDK